MYGIAYSSGACNRDWRIKNGESRDRNREAYGVRRVLAAFPFKKEKRRGLAALLTLARAPQLNRFSSERDSTRGIDP